MDNKRNYGIDLLKTISMLMIIAMHILGYGGVQLGKEVRYLLLSLSYCSVNCYALASGYNSIDSRFKVSRILNLWGETLFYSIGIAGIYLLFGGTLDEEDILTCLLPVSCIHYWYFTEYFRLFLIIPLLNAFVKRAKRKTIRSWLVAVVIVSVMFQSKIQRGYHVVWLAVLYMCGAYIKKYGKDHDRRKIIFIYLICSGITWISQIIGGLSAKVLLLEYTSPTVFLAAIALLICFTNIEISAGIQKIVLWLGKRTFGVYLIHTHIVVWRVFLANRFTYIGDWGIISGVICLVITVIVVFLICSVIDEMREHIWKVLKVKKYMDKIDCLVAEQVMDSPAFRKIKKYFERRDYEICKK